MEIKYELVLHCMTLAAADEIELNTIGEIKTRYSNMPGYYIIQWTGHAYNLQGKYTCHALYPPVIIPEGEIFCPAKFMTPMRKTSYWYHGPDESIPVMVKLKQVVMTYIEIIQDNNTTNEFPSSFKVYADKKPHVLSEHDNQIILDKIESIENINHYKYVEDETYNNVYSDESDDDDN